MQRNALLPTLVLVCFWRGSCLIDWLIGLSHSGKLSSCACKCRTLYWLALWNFRSLCCWRVISLLLRTLFEFLFFFFFDRRSRRMLVSSDALGPRLSLLKPADWKRLVRMIDVPRKLAVTTRTIFPPPHLAQMVSKEEPQGRHLDPGVGLLANTTDGARTANSFASWTDKTATHLARSRSVRLGVVHFEKSLVANLSAKRQLSVAKLSAKRIISLAKRDFSVANGRMAADFSSPV